MAFYGYAYTPGTASPGGYDEYVGEWQLERRDGGGGFGGIPTYMRLIEVEHKGCFGFIVQFESDGGGAGPDRRAQTPCTVTALYPPITWHGQSPFPNSNFPEGQWPWAWNPDHFWHQPMNSPLPGWGEGLHPVDYYWALEQEIGQVGLTPYWDDEVGYRIQWLTTRRNPAYDGSTPRPDKIPLLCWYSTGTFDGAAPSDSPLYGVAEPPAGRVRIWRYWLSTGPGGPGGGPGGGGDPGAFTLGPGPPGWLRHPRRVLGQRPTPVEMPTPAEPPPPGDGGVDT